MNDTASDDQAKTKGFRAAFAARDEAMVRGFAMQFAINPEDARKYLEGADWNYPRAFDALLVSLRTADETEGTAKALAAIVTPPTAIEIRRHIELGDKGVCVDCRTAPATTTVPANCGDKGSPNGRRDAVCAICADERRVK
jgi:hypothetical protein